MRSELKADLALLSVSLVWGASFPILSLVLKYVGPYTFLAVRYTLAGVILSTIIFKRIKNMDKKTFKAGLLIGVSFFLGCLFQTIGLVYTTPSKSGFISGLTVVLIPMFMAIIYKKMPDIKTIMGIICSIIGLSIISLSGPMGINIGDVLTIICAVAFSIQILQVDKYVRGIDVIAMSCVQMFVIGICSFCPGIIVEKLYFPINKITIGCLIFTVAFCTIYAFIIQNKMQPKTKPTHAAIILLAEPVFSAIFSIFVGDKLTGRTFAGCIFILLGMAIVNIRFKSDKVVENIKENEIDI